MKSLKSKSLIAMVSAVFLVVIAATPAHAANYAIAGQFNCNTSVVTHANYNAHTAGAVAKLNLAHIWWHDAETRFGLRNTSNTQVTLSLSFWARETPGTTKSFKNTSGGLAIPGTSLAMNSRLVASNDCVPIPSFDGTLTL